MIYVQEHDAFHVGDNVYYRIQKNARTGEWQVCECTMGTIALDCSAAFPINYQTKQEAKDFVAQKDAEWKEAHPDSPKPKPHYPRGG